jgi:hypothetical protein
MYMCMRVLCVSVWGQCVQSNEAIIKFICACIYIYIYIYIYMRMRTIYTYIHRTPYIHTGIFQGARTYSSPCAGQRSLVTAYNGVYVCMHVCMIVCVCMHACMVVCIYDCMRVYVVRQATKSWYRIQWCVCVCVCMYVCMYGCVYVCM